VRRGNPILAARYLAQEFGSSHTPASGGRARARLAQPNGGMTEWKSYALRAYQRRTLAADALIASPLSCEKAGKARTFTSVRDASGNGG
jgi:hypothetical protein